MAVILVLICYAGKTVYTACCYLQSWYWFSVKLEVSFFCMKNTRHAIKKVIKLRVCLCQRGETNSVSNKVWLLISNVILIWHLPGLNFSGKCVLYRWQANTTNTQQKKELCNPLYEGEYCLEWIKSAFIVSESIIKSSADSDIIFVKIFIIKN